MAVTISRIDGSATIGTTEYSLPNAGTTLTPITTDVAAQAWIDFSAMAAGDQYRVTVYEKINGGSQLVAIQFTLEGAQSTALVIPQLLMTDGWDVTIKKLAGTDRSIGWSIRYPG